MSFQMSKEKKPKKGEDAGASIEEYLQFHTLIFPSARFVSNNLGPSFRPSDYFYKTLPVYRDKTDSCTYIVREKY